MLKHLAVGFVVTAALGAGASFGASVFEMYTMDNIPISASVAGAVFLSLFGVWMTGINSFFKRRFHVGVLADVESLTQISTQTRRDSWSAVSSLVHGFLQKTGGNFSLSDVKREFQDVKKVNEKGGVEIREALKELGTIRHET